MIFSSNKLRDIRNLFQSKLSDLYSTNEINSIFFLLTKKYLKFSSIDYSLKLDSCISESELLMFNFALKQLILNTPVQYIIGETSFMDMQFNVSPGVLIPRPETEELIQLVLANTTKKNTKILDIGTGSGCIAISLQKHLPNSNVYAIDNSPAALRIAINNALLNDVVIDFIEGDILNQHFSISHTFDVIVSNPPYVLESEKDKMHANVLLHEPSEALFVSDEDPLLYYRAILEFAKLHLAESGMVFFEMNEMMSKPLIELCLHYGYSEVTCLKDIHGKDRFVHAK